MIKLKLRKSCDIIHTVKKLVKLENWDSSLKLKPYISDLDLSPLAGIQTQSKPCLGPKPTWLGLKPSQNPAWDLNQRVWDSNPAKIHGIWFLDLMKIRFLMSHHWKNSVRDKVIGKKWIYSDTERSTFHRQSMGHRREWMWPINLAWLVFIGWVIIYANEWEDYSNYLGERADVSRIWATTHSLVF